MNDYLLCISIPTYKRLAVFKRLMKQLSREVCSLNEHKQRLIAISIFDNPSDFTPAKKSLIYSLSFGSASMAWTENKVNIGGEANVEQCCLANDQCSYTWVIGDDEQLIPGSVENIILHLSANPDCGLLVLRDPNYSIHNSIIKKGRWSNCHEFMKHLSLLQPHFIIAHTLITCNIFKTNIFLENTSKLERLVFSPRAGLPTSFPHMMGFLAGLSLRNDLSIDLLLTAAIDTSSRAASEEIQELSDPDMMERLYRHYLYWIGHEFGIDINTLKLHPSMKNIFITSRTHKTMLSLGRKSGAVASKIKSLLKFF